MSYKRDFKLTKEQEENVQKLLKEGKEKYKEFDHVICESILTEEELKKCGYYD